MKSSIIKEEWRFIPEFEGYYQMSNLCRFRSVDRVVDYTNQSQRLHKGCILKLKEQNNGYFSVGLCKNNKVKFYLVHRLLAITFPEIIDWTEEAKGKSIEQLQINHKNECKWDNNYWNLEWCTKEYNNSYGTKIDKTINKLGKPVLQYTLNGDLIGEFRSCGEAEKQTGISKNQINYCCLNKPHCKTAGGYIWKYSNKKELLNIT